MAITLGMLYLVAKALRGLDKRADAPRKVLSLGYPDIVAAPTNFAEFFGADVAGKLIWRPDSAEIIRHHHVERITDRIVDSVGFFSLLGYTLEVADISEIRGGERILDLNEPCPAEMHCGYGLVIDAGTCEHVFNIGQAAKSVAQMTASGGYVLSCASLSMFNHGFYNLSPTWYHDFFGGNGFTIEALYRAQHAEPATLQEVDAYARFGTAPDNSLMLMLARRDAVQDIKWPVQFKYRNLPKPVHHASANALPAAQQGNVAHATKVTGKATQKDDDKKQAMAGALLVYARGLAADHLEKQTRKRRDALMPCFDALAADSRGGLDIFVFHARMKNQERVEYRDTSYDPAQHDFDEILNQFAVSARSACPTGRILLVTDEETRFEEALVTATSVVRLPIDADIPMYERVLAMNAFVHSEAFSRNTLFLDSDAFINKPLDEVFQLRFDVAVTVRPMLGVMPVNEGVILCKAERREAVRRFFDCYLATYDLLSADGMIKGYYGNARRWRGGQLALNTACAGLAPYNSRDIVDCLGALVRALPCEHFNHAFEYGSLLQCRDLDQAYILHFKGARKAMLEEYRALSRETAVLAGEK